MKSIIRKLRLKIYNILVNRVPAIREKYLMLRKSRKGNRGRLYAWMMLFVMNVAWVAGKREAGIWNQHLKNLRKIPQNKSESFMSAKEKPEEFAQKLLEYDVISFDVFDTLLFRPFFKPSDLFFLVGEKLNYLNFDRIRLEMELKARQDCFQKKGHAEVSLEEIYDYVEAYTGIPKEAGMRAEIETEKEVCVANPYMLQVFSFLKKTNKTIIAVSDMYLPEVVIREIVEKCGYTGMSGCYISGELQISKNNGGLFQFIRNKYGPKLRYIHVGDNPYSDVEMALKYGWESAYYRNVNDAGASYRVNDMSVITGSIYKGIVNAHIHNGLTIYNKEYEWGFIYGGLFVFGYCQFIHEYVKNHNIDKILFLARDGDILIKAYRMMYPEESDDEKAEYVYWSRLAAAKMTAEYYKYDYFRRFLYHKTEQRYTFAQIFQSMEITDMLQKMCTILNNSADRKSEKFSAETVLTSQNVERVKEYLLANWKEVQAHYEEQLEAGKIYYSRVLEGCRRVIAVDAGWAGSGAVALNYVVNAIWNMDCLVTGLVAGTNTIYNAEPDMSEPQLFAGQLISYMYSQAHNRDLWKRHDAEKGHNLCLELLLASPHGSFSRFEKTAEGGWRAVCKEPDVEEKTALKIQKGILDFVTEAIRAWGKWPGEAKISGRDAYEPVRTLMEQVKYNCAFELQTGMLETGI